VAFAKLQTMGASDFILIWAPNFDLENRDGIFLQSSDTHLPNHTASYVM